MSVIALDTHSIVRRLKAAGFSEDQAEAVTGVIREAREAEISNLVTKTDLAEAKFEILKWVLSAIGFQAIIIVGAIVALSRGLH